jgi:RecB family exonuclease
MGCIDAELAAARASDRLRQSPALWGSPGPSVCVYGFDDLTELQLDAIETLAVVGQAHVFVSLAYETGRVAFAERAATFKTLLPWATEHICVPPATGYYAEASRGALGHLERNLFQVALTEVAPTEAAVTEVAPIEALPTQAPPTADPAGAVRLLEGGSQRAELELVASEVRALLDSGYAPGEIAVVHRSPHQISGTLEEVFAAHAIAVSPVGAPAFDQTAIGRGLIALVRCTLPEGRPADLVAWLRTPGVVRNQDLVDGFERAITREALGTVAEARSAWERVRWPLSALDRVAAAAEHGGGALTERVKSELWRLFERPRVGHAQILQGAEREEAWALAAASALLDQLGQLASADGGARVDVGVAEIVAALESLSATAPGSARSEGVPLLDPLQLRARRVRALFVCCLQEGVFPKPAASPPFLSDAERANLARKGGLSLRRQSDQVARERYLFYACLSRPEELLALSWHTADDDGNPQARSLFVDDVCDLFDQSLETRCRHRPLGAIDADAGRSRSRAGDSSRMRPLSDQRLIGPPGPDRPWSASALESYAACPVRWFVERLLRPGGLDPEAEPLAAGTVIHAVLRDVMEGLRLRTGVGRPTPQNVGVAIGLMRDSLARQAEIQPLAADPAQGQLALRRMEAGLGRFLQQMAEQASEFEPKYLELAFGFGPGEDPAEHPGEDPAEDPEVPHLPTLDLGGGVHLRGRIDRIDVDAAGRALVYDYKRSSAGAKPAAKWLAERSFQVALYMRACRDLLGLDVVGGFYQPVMAAEPRARGVLADDAKAPAVRTDIRSHDDLGELEMELCEQARQAAVGAAGGQLEPRPRTCPFSGTGCSYPAICGAGDGSV